MQKNLRVARVEEGVKLAKVGQHSAAMKKYHSALEVDPGNTDAITAKGAAYFNVEYVVVCARAVYFIV